MQDSYTRERKFVCKCMRARSERSERSEKSVEGVPTNLSCCLALFYLLYSTPIPGGRMYPVLCACHSVHVLYISILIASGTSPAFSCLMFFIHYVTERLGMNL